MKRINILFFAFLFIVNIFAQTKYDFPQNIASPFVEDSSGKKITRDDVSHYLHGLNIARGKVNGMRTLRKFGQNPSVGTTSTEVIWALGGNYTFLSSAQKLKISSSSTNDVFGTGAGAWNIQIEGLDGDFNETTEVIALNGTNAVTSTIDFFRVNRAYVLFTGATATLGCNIGNISIRDNANTNTIAYILAGKGQTQQLVYTVPAGHTAYLTYVDHSVIDRASRIQGWIRSNLLPGLAWRSQVDYYMLGALGTNLTAPEAVPEKTDVLYTAQNEDVSQTSAVAGEAYFILIRNDVE